MPSMAGGALIAICGTFPLAAVCALAFRFPIPMSGYSSGTSAMLPALSAVVFYGSMGGFVVQGLMGAICALVAMRIKPHQSHSPCLLVALSLIGAVPGVMIMAVLDWIIGPW